VLIYFVKYGKEKFSEWLEKSRKREDVVFFAGGTVWTAIQSQDGRDRRR
jgi:hypothetical protein